MMPVCDSRALHKNTREPKLAHRRHPFPPKKRLSMRPHGKAKLGFFPLPPAEAERLRNCLTFPREFSAVDPCVGDGVAFTCLLKDTQAHRYAIEIDANRAEQARSLG